MRDRPRLSKKIRSLTALGFTFSLFIGNASFAPQPDSALEEILVLRGGKLIDGTGAQPIAASTLVIRDGSILYAGPSSEVVVPSQAKIVSTTGLYILPGFVNTQVFGLPSEDQLWEWARSGITTIRVLGTDEAWLDEVLEPRHSVTPHVRILVGSPMFTRRQGFPHVPYGFVDSSAFVRSTEQALSRVRKFLALEIDTISLVRESGTIFGTALPTLSAKELKILTRYSRGMGVPVSAHVTCLADAGKVAAARVSDMSHMIADRLIPERLIKRIIKAGITIVPTLSAWQQLGEAPLTIARINLRNFIDAGGRVGFGTDFAGYPALSSPGMPLDELQLMTESGMSPMQIIVACSKNSADLCNLGRTLGTLEKHKAADLFVVQGDPLRDINHLENVRMVIRDGVVILNRLRD